MSQSVELKSLIDGFIRRLEQAAQVFLRRYDLRLDDGKIFEGVRISNKLEYRNTDPNSDVFYIFLYFVSPDEDVQSDSDYRQRIPVAAGQWFANSMTYSLLDGPKFFADFLHDSLGFGVSGVYEPFESFREDYERLSERTLSIVS